MDHLYQLSSVLFLNLLIGLILFVYYIIVIGTEKEIPVRARIQISESVAILSVQCPIPVKGNILGAYALPYLILGLPDVLRSLFPLVVKKLSAV